MKVIYIRNLLLQSDKSTVVLLLLAAVAWLFIGSGAAALTVSLLFSYKIVFSLTNKKIFDSKMFVLIVAIFFYAILLQCMSLSVWVLSRNFPLDSTIYLTLAFLIISYAYFQRTTLKELRIEPPSFTFADIIALTIGIVVTTGIFLVPILKGGLTLSTISISSINASVDDSHHIEFINDRLQFNRGVLFHSDAINELRNRDAVSSYPAGWHSANAVLIRALSPDTTTGTQSIVVYAMTKIFWFILLLFVFTRAVFVVYRLFSQKPISLPITLWLSSSSFLFSIFFLIAPFRQGFYSFLPQLTAVLLLGLVLAQIAGNRKDPSLYRQSLVMAAILCIGGGLSWILVLPGMGLALLIIMGLHFFRKGPSAGFRDTIASIVMYLPFYLLLLVALFVQFYVMAKSSTTIPFVEHITTQGPIEVYPAVFYTFLAVGLVLCGVLLSNRASEYLKSYLALLTSLFFISAIIGLIQFFHLFDYSYYYYKALNVFTVVAIPIALAGFGLLIKKYSDKNGLFIGLSLVALLLLTTIQSVGPNPGYPNGLIGGSVHGQIAREEIDYFKGGRVMPQSSTTVLWGALENSQNSYGSNNVTIFYNEGKVSQNEIMTLIVKTNAKQNGCIDALNQNLHKADTFDTLLNFIQLNCKNMSVKIITDESNANSFKESVRKKDPRNISINSI